MNEAMIDLETLAKEPEAAVISIGVAIFNDKEVVDSAGWGVAPAYWHGIIDPETVAWWADPERDGAREFSFKGNHTDFAVAFELKTFLAKHDAKFVWSNDPHFDHVILERWWKRIGQHPIRSFVSPNPGTFPITYKQPRSYRTIVSEAERLGHYPKEFAGTYVAHNPVDDAVSQARVVIAARKLIGGVA